MRAVLSIVGLALINERSLRRDATGKLDKIGQRVTKMQSAVETMQSATPYRVLLHDSIWDIAESDGSLVRVTRRKRIKFNQNEVVSLLDFVQGDGTRESEYSPGQVVHEFQGETKRYSLIALD